MWSIPRLRAWRLAIAGPVFYSYFTLFYLLLLRGGSASAFRTFLLLAAIIVYFANGFLINDLADRANDQAAGKRSASRGHDLSVGTMVSLIVLTGVASVLLAIGAGGDAFYYGLWAVSFLLSVMYSTPPVALKRRGISGAIGDSLIERPLPILIIFSFFGAYRLEMVLFPILSELSWSVFKHQVADYDGDKASGVRTFAVRLGKERSLAMLKWFLNPVAVASQALLLLIAWFTFGSERSVVAGLLVLYLFGVVLSKLLESRIHIRTTITDPPYIMFSNFAYKFLILPVLCLLVVFSTPQFAFVLVVLVISLVPHVRDYLDLARSVGSTSKGGGSP